MPRTYHYVVNTRDVDFKRQASLIAISDYVIQAATQDSDNCNSGLQFLNARGFSWVLIRMAIEMIRYPKQHEKFQVKTWVESIDKLMVKRNMSIHNEDGEIIGNAITYWCILNLESRSTVACNSAIFDHFTDYINPAKPTIAAPARIRAFDDGEVTFNTVRYSHIDFNGHTNTSKYISWMLNSIDIDYFTGYEIERLDINFSHETRYNDIIKTNIKMEVEAKSESLFSITNKESSQPVCSAKIRWVQNK